MKTREGKSQSIEVVRLEIKSGKKMDTSGGGFYTVGLGGIID